MTPFYGDNIPLIFLEVLSVCQIEFVENSRASTLVNSLKPVHRTVNHKLGRHERKKEMFLFDSKFSKMRDGTHPAPCAMCHN